MGTGRADLSEMLVKSIRKPKAKPNLPPLATESKNVSSIAPYLEKVK